MSLRHPSIFPVNEVLQVTLFVMKEQGKFVSAKEAKETNTLPTSHYVLKFFKSGVEMVHEIMKVEYIDQVVTYFSNLRPETSDNFILTVQSILRSGMVSERMIGFIVALPHTFDTRSTRARKLMNISTVYASSHYMGQESSRDEFLLKLVSIEDAPKLGPGTKIFRVEDQEKNLGYMFGKQLLIDGAPLTINDCFLCNATVKSHEVDKISGIKQTFFNRVKVTANIGKSS
jgi:hypothetical protein